MKKYDNKLNGNNPDREVESNVFSNFTFKYTF